MDVQATGTRGLAALRRADAAIGAAAHEVTDVRGWWAFALAAAFVVSAALKLANVGIGGPQYMIDDFSLYEGGFLVWFGQAPPQHAYLECWISGACSIAVFLVRTAMAGSWEAAREGLVLSAALRDFYNAPDVYYAAYRVLLTTADLATAWLVFRTARLLLRDIGWAVWVAVLFLFTYNTAWCALVGRPDTLMTLAAAAGVYLYVRSGGDETRRAFWWAAVCFGLAAGLKMHGAFFVIFAAADVLRRRGIRNGWRTAAAFAAAGFFFFLVADGSLLFDPLKYVKARWATYHDDYSAYLHWGQQFTVILRSTGWVLAPLAAWGAFRALRDRTAPPALKSVAVLALGWLTIFCLTRQLRGYWMLPVVPLLYLLAAVALRDLPRRARTATALAVVALMAGQTAAASWRTHHTDLNELRAWVTANVRRDQPFYILGETVLRLPKSTAAMHVYKQAYEREAATDLAAGMPFAERHVKNWEEQSILRLFDMIGYRNDQGYTFYSYREMPPDKFADLVSLDRMEYLLVQERFPIDAVPGLRSLLANQFRFVTTRRSEGGDGSGLVHRIYERRGREAAPIG